MKKNILYLLFLLIPSTSFAASSYIYKYQDKDGNFVYTDNMPPSVKGEFSLLSSKSGTIKKVVEKELNAEEITIRDEKIKEEKAIIEKSEAEKKRDVALLSTYTNVDEIEKMKNYELNQIQQGLKNNNDTINVLQKRLDTLRANEKLNPQNKELKNEIERTESDVNLAKQALNSNQDLLEQRTKKYEEDKKRYLEIVSGMSGKSE